MTNPEARPRGLSFSIEGIGVVGPGLQDWHQTAAVLSGAQAWVPQETIITAPSLLHAAERRRAGATVKLSLAVADQACRHAGVDLADLPTVFSASSADGVNCHQLCETLAQADRLVSPTRFTNSVHNAAAGYWHIATRSHAASTSLCAFDASFAAGLLEAASQCCAQGRPVLLVVTDVPYPEPLHAVRPIRVSLGVALVLAAQATSRSVARVCLSLVPETVPITRLAHVGLEALRGEVPAARCLAWLQSLAQDDEAACVIEGLNAQHLCMQRVQEMSAAGA